MIVQVYHTYPKSTFIMQSVITLMEKATLATTCDEISSIIRSKFNGLDIGTIRVLDVNASDNISIQRIDNLEEAAQ